MKDYTINTEKEKLIRKFALWLNKNKEKVLKNWIYLANNNDELLNQAQINIFKQCFTTLINDFIKYLSLGQFEQYYNSNRIAARELSISNITFEQFIKVFHLFEESYISLLTKDLTYFKFHKYLIAIDDLHHTTIAIVSEEYFAINDITVLALVKLTELRDVTTGHHLEHTRDYSILLAKEYGLDSEFIICISKASLLHDIGKIGIKDSILLKPGKLTNEEFDEMKKHTIIGAESIDNILHNQKVITSYLTMSKDIALYHHEKYNGSGYPHALKGDDIPLSARIFAIADSYDAIVSRRPYKEALTHEEAVKRIELDSGVHFDPKIVQVFLKNHMKFKDINNNYNSLEKNY